MRNSQATRESLPREFYPVAKLFCIFWQPKLLLILNAQNHIVGCMVIWIVPSYVQSLRHSTVLWNILNLKIYPWNQFSGIIAKFFDKKFYLLYSTNKHLYIISTQIIYTHIHTYVHIYFNMYKCISLIKLCMSNDHHTWSMSWWISKLWA